ncbi:hypothetical protein LIER_34393 [Lithospermum erythrorhizon]|uniref:Clp R domain-containing protein n=1 Tax=Lithospermum erythrorhizon TaxID=34254 RepID=A0AAV3S1Q5_LITER
MSMYPRRILDCRHQFPTYHICPSTPSSSSSSFFGNSLSIKFAQTPIYYTPKRSFYIVSGVFERFTEGSIKAVMFAQKEAKLLGENEVSTQHLLLGLVAEDRGQAGFLGYGITLDKACEAVKSIWKVDNDFGTGGKKMVLQVTWHFRIV